jgi:indole-3-glycerol phosphate synthase
MTNVLQKIVAHKRQELAANSNQIDELKAQVLDIAPPLDFVAALSAPGVSLIAEVKKASPSKGVIREDFQPIEIAQAYKAGGASCVSILTDEKFFQGHLDFLTAIRAECDLPLLRKDFILSELQIYEARAAGADAVLLIAECLTPSDLQRLHDCVGSLGMTALVEFYDYENLDAVLQCQPKLVGVNNRDLKTFEINLEHSGRIREEVPNDVLFVSESGIFTHADVRRLVDWKVDAMLVGESLMRQTDIVVAVKNLLGNS